jgi:hypothetical protein
MRPEDLSVAVDLLGEGGAHFSLKKGSLFSQYVFMSYSWCFSCVF